MARLCIRVAALLAATLTVFTVAIPLRYNALVNPPYPLLLFQFEHCTTPCWMGVEVGKTDRNTVNHTLATLGMTNANASLEHMPIIQTSSYHSFNAQIFVNDRGISNLMYLNLDAICMEDVIAAYGYPDMILTQRHTTRFIYNDLNMTVTLQSRHHYRDETVKIAFRTPQNTVATDGNGVFQSVTWEQATTQAAQRCNRQ